MLTRISRQRRRKLRIYCISGSILIALLFAVWFGIETWKRENVISLPMKQFDETSQLCLERRKEPQLSMSQLANQMVCKSADPNELDESKELAESKEDVAYVNSRNGVISIDPALLVLVNKNNRIPLDYQVELTQLNNKRNSVAAVMYEALSEMLTDGTKEGLSFYIASGYRSYEKQQMLIEEDVASFMNQGMSYEEAYEETLKETMPAGFSEHQTGLAVDIVSAQNANLTIEQLETEENKWLQENCYKYGFIVRYPQDKSEITHIDYEPWHFRYVGKTVAKYIMEHDLTLEEFLETIEE